MDRVCMLFMIAIVLSMPVFFLVVTMAKGILFAATTFPIALIGGARLAITWWGYRTQVNVLFGAIAQMVCGRRMA
jgi:hypothetical protein